MRFIVRLVSLVAVALGLLGMAAAGADSNTVLVGRIEEPRLAVVHEVALVDRLEPQRVGLPPEG